MIKAQRRATERRQQQFATPVLATEPAAAPATDLHHRHNKEVVAHPPAAKDPAPKLTKSQSSFRPADGTGGSSGNTRNFLSIGHTRQQQSDSGKPKTGPDYVRAILNKYYTSGSGVLGRQQTSASSKKQQLQQRRAYEEMMER